jgi:hypothetical protein
MQWIKAIDFLKSQINNAVMQHRTLVEKLEAHEKQAEDQRYRDLCSTAIPQMREHQRMLEEYQKESAPRRASPRTCSVRHSAPRVTSPTRRARVTSCGSSVTS